MGQYYKGYVKNLNDNTLVFDSWDYNNGAKLTEHSWVGNNMVDAVCTYIRDNPCIIGWFGDYSNDTEEYHRDENIQKIYQQLWIDRDKSFNFKMPTKGIRRLMRRGYLINNTQKIYIPMKEYFALNKDNENWCLNPLPLLTALGNGQGGGDYHGPNQEAVGTWFLDEILYSKEAPNKDFQKVMYEFKDV